MACHAIYWQKARTKSKDIGGSDRLTAICYAKGLTENIASSALIHGVTSHKKNCNATFIGNDDRPGKLMMMGERIRLLNMLGFKFQLLPRIEVILSL
jgi:hypothetical protein